LGIGPNPQSPIPNPQSPIPNININNSKIKEKIKIINKIIKLKYKIYFIIIS